MLVVSFIFNMAQTWILQKTGQKIILTVRRELYIHIQSLSSRFFDLTPVGKLVTRVTNDVEALNEMYSGILVRLFRNIVKIIGLAVVMIALDRGLALVSFVLLPIVMVLTVVFRIISRKHIGLYAQSLQISIHFYLRIFQECASFRSLDERSESSRSLRIRITSCTAHTTVR